MPIARPSAHRLLLLLPLVLAACANDRLLRISPLGGDSPRERVNLWPIAYHDGAGTSLLWPIFDIDGQGFALRPLLSKDGTRWSSLWPWAAFDERTGTGWAFPFYKFEKNAGLFPVANFGDDFSYVTLAWWARDGRGELSSGGLFPVAHFGGFNYLGPLYWTGGDGEGRGSAGLFPVAGFGDFNYVGPAWWRAGGDAHGLFPLYGYGELKHVGPVWWSENEQGEGQGGLFPFFWMGAGGRSLGVLPFYWHTREGEETSRYYALGLGRSTESPEGSTHWLLPFFWSSSEGARERLLSLVGHRFADEEGRSSAIYPLWWSWGDEESSKRMLLPFFYYEQDGDERSLVTPLGGRGWSVDGESRYTNVLGPLYHHGESADGERETTAFLWPLYMSSRDGESRTFRSFPFYSRTLDPDFSDSWYAFGLGHTHRDEEGSSHRFWPLFSSSTEEQPPDLFYNLSLYRDHEANGQRSSWLFPLYSSRSNAEEVSRSLLLFVGDYYRGPDRRAWRAWPLAAVSEGEDRRGPFDWLTLYGRSQDEGRSSLHLGTPLVYLQGHTRTPELERSSRRILTFFAQSSEEHLGLHLPAGEKPTGSNRVRQSKGGLLFDAILSRDETYAVWEEGAVTREEAGILHPFSDRYEGSKWVRRDEAAAREVLARHGHTVDPEDPDSLRRALVAFAERNSKRVEHATHRFPLLYNYERTGEGSSWSGPLWLIRSSTEHDPRRESFSLLYYLYRSESTEAGKTRDIFPFITYDTGPGKLEWSFLWRLLHYRKSGEESGGHLFFVPFGDI